VYFLPLEKSLTGILKGSEHQTSERILTKRDVIRGDANAWRKSA
jgi:hypothetical protein